jgi:hypothetical protein
MFRPAVILMLVLLLTPVAVVAVPPEKGPQQVLEQNLDANGYIRVHEQGTVPVQGAVSVDNLVDVLTRLDTILTRMEQAFQVGGSVEVTNLPLQPRADDPGISALRVLEQGTVNVAVANWPPLPDVGNVNVVSPSPLPISGAVSLATVAGDPLYPVQVANMPGQPVPVAGVVNVGNLPPVQQVAGAVEVSNFPTSQQVEVTGPVDHMGNVRMATGRRAQTVFLGTVQIAPGTPYEYPPLDVSGAEMVRLWCWTDYWDSLWNADIFWQVGPGARVLAWSPVVGPLWSVRDLTPVKGPYMVFWVRNHTSQTVTVSAYAYITW